MSKSKIYLHTEQNHQLKDPNIIVPHIYNALKPESVLDIGCGTGTFINVFKKNGVKKVIGVDGKWVDKQLLLKNIEEEEFIEADLEMPINLNRKFDLALCLEVAEHLSEKKSDVIVENLIRHSDILIFSAAVPGQGGQNHINEQWTNYWISKFAKHDFVFHDVLRSFFWDNKDVFWWYKQNVFLVTHKSLNHCAVLFQSDAKGKIFDYIHPELLTEKVDLIRKIESGNGTTKFYVTVFFKYVKRIFRKLF